MKSLNKLTLLIATILFSINISAQDVYWGSYKYRIISTKSKTVEFIGGLSTSTESVTIPQTIKYNEEDYKVVSIAGYTFKSLSKLKEVTLPNTIKSIGDYAFSNSGLKSINIPSSVEVIGTGAFNNCNISAIKIPSDVKIIHPSTFYGCSNLRTVTISGYKMEIRTSAFSGCYTLESIRIPDGTTLIGANAFSGCQKLNTIHIPSKVEEIGDNAFSDCSNLSHVSINNANVKIGNYAFTRCSNLTNISLGNSVISIGLGSFTYTKWYNNQPNGLLYLDKYCLGYKETKPSGTLEIKNDVEVIANSAFKNCSNLKNVIMPSSLKTIGDDAFNNCSMLNDITIPSTVSKIGENAFMNSGWYNIQKDGILYLNNCCVGYKGEMPSELTLKNDTRLVAASAFYSCTKLKSVTIPSSVKNIGNDAFYYCTNLLNVYTPSFNSWCEIEFENGNANPSAENFYVNNELITDFVIPNDIIEIKNYTFYAFNNMNSVTIPSSVKKIGEEAFSHCSNLTSLRLPGVTDIEKLAFSSCANLTKITFGKYIDNIGNFAFAGNPIISEIKIINETAPTCGTLVFNGIDYDNAKLIIPKGRSYFYGYTFCWRDFINVVEEDMSSIENNIEDENTCEVARYDINGRLLLTPTKGLNIVKFSNGSVKKIYVK